MSDLDTLRAAITALESRLAALPPSPRGSMPIAAYSAALARQHDAQRQLIADIFAQQGGRLTQGAAGWRLALHGIAASATEGPAAAVRNWIAAARRKTDTARTNAGQPADALRDVMRQALAYLTETKA